MTEADRELLELAADAAKLHWEWNGVNQRIEVLRSSGHYRHWSPLDDDGDAFRLMVNLNISVSRPVLGDSEVHWGAYADSHDQCISLKVCDDGDPLAATRRAITRAAAAIQEGK